MYFQDHSTRYWIKIKSICVHFTVLLLTGRILKEPGNVLTDVCIFFFEFSGCLSLWCSKLSVCKETSYLSQWEQKRHRENWCVCRMWNEKPHWLEKMPKEISCCFDKNFENWWWGWWPLLLCQVLRMCVYVWSSTAYPPPTTWEKKLIFTLRNVKKLYDLTV